MPEEREFTRTSALSSSEILTVSQLARSVRDVLEHRFPLLWVRGEISNLAVSRSGHAYFVLKDAQAQIRCVMFRSRCQQLDWQPRDGMHVEVRALVTLYEARGEFQLTVEAMRAAGRGVLYEAFLKLKEKLQAEGLFDESVKRPLPFLPRAVGVITSTKAAALSDVLTTLRRRNPSIPVIVYPVPVQGADAADHIVRALATAGERRECDVLVLCRGGGSIEDLWCFNDESVARAIRACPIPVVCGVGHETDFTIADFAADRRAPTPTGAAELVSPPRAELLRLIASCVRRISVAVHRQFDIREQTLDYVSRRLSHPLERLSEKERHLKHLQLRLSRAMAQRVEEGAWRASSLMRRMQALRPRTDELDRLVQTCAARLVSAFVALNERRRERLESLRASLEHLAPAGVLERGYSLVLDARGRIVRDAATLSAGDELELRFARGQARARVESSRG